jgi:hypothetical protein
VPIAELLQRLLATRRANLIQFVGWVAERAVLRAGLTVEDAGTAVWALSSTETHHLLTVDLGWPAERFATWLANALVAHLLPPERAASSASLGWPTVPPQGTPSRARHNPSSGTILTVALNSPASYTRWPRGSRPRMTRRAVYGRHTS